MRTNTRVVALALLLCASLGSRAQQANASSGVPNPTVFGPIAAGVVPGDPSRDYPFFSTDADLASQGYIEAEYFIEGLANRYTITSALATASMVDSGHPYRTRIVVRRPLSAARFNGTVLMEWRNNATGYDIDGVWAASQGHIMRRGYAWIGVTAFRAGVHTPVMGLRAWNPGRYGTLDVTAGGTVLNDALSFDIFSQAAQAVKAPIGIDPMDGLLVQWVLGLGASQSANNGIVPYHNNIHPLAGVFDGTIGSIRAALEPFKSTEGPLSDPGPPTHGAD